MIWHSDKRHILAYGLILLCSCASAPPSRTMPLASPQPDDPSIRVDYRGAVKHLRSSLRRAIDRVEILHIDERTVFRVTPSSSTIENNYDYKLTFVANYSIKNSSFVNDLVSELEKLEPQPSEVPADIRWACIFCDGDGAKVFGVYFDKSGELGVVNNACFRFGSTALRRFVDPLPKVCFR